MPDMHIVIAELAGLYDELNKRWGDDSCIMNVYQVYRQKEYRDAYERLKEVNVESIALKIIADSVSDKVLSRLRGLISDNISIYKTRQTEFNSIEFDKLYQLWEDHLFTDKRALLLRDKEMIKDYPYPSEQERQTLLKENQRDINELDNERNDLHRTDALWIGKNYYPEIYELSRSFVSILDSYFPVETKTESAIEDITSTPEQSAPFPKEGYFSMDLIASLHNVCNNVQFENLPALDFYALINLQPANGRLIVKPGERTRVCYLIHKMYEYLKTDNRSDWRNAILKALEIKEGFYQSKYKEAASNTGRQSERFVQQIDEIFD